MASSNKDGITIRTMTIEDYPSVKAFLKDNFFQSEPLCQSTSENVQSQNEKENDEYHLSMIAQGTCLVAIDESNGGRFVGLVLAGIPRTWRSIALRRSPWSSTFGLAHA